MLWKGHCKRDLEHCGKGRTRREDCDWSVICVSKYTNRQQHERACTAEERLVACAFIDGRTQSYSKV